MTSRNTPDRHKTAAQVTAARKKRKWTQADLADAAGVSLRSVGNLENGAKVSDKTVDLVAHALGWQGMGINAPAYDHTADAAPPGTDEHIQEAVRFLPTVLTYYGAEVYEAASARVSAMLRERRTDDELGE